MYRTEENKLRKEHKLVKKKTIWCEPNGVGQLVRHSVSKWLSCVWLGAMGTSALKKLHGPAIYLTMDPPVANSD